MASISEGATYDVIVVGSGHAGIEAALASARLGCRTLMLTQNLDTIGQMSCNPAIGGSAKSHLVREIDALGGAMALNADATGLQFRTLNKTKGPAMWATRIQCDKRAYQMRMKAVLENASGLEMLQGTATEILTKAGKVTGLYTDLGIKLSAHSIVITAGTFLRALLHVGENKKAGGRMADASSNLSESIASLGVQVSRFKTGTPCRINLNSVDFSQLEMQAGDEPAPRLATTEMTASSIRIRGLNFDANGMFHVEQMPCWITRTSTQTHEIIRRNLHRSPLFSGRIKGKGPRYCPSIEDKVTRFVERESHQIFLEPEGRTTAEMYVNGLSTSLPFDVQVEIVHSIQGLAQAEIMRPGYAVEYDFFPPTQLSRTLETKAISGLFLAGQVNGTSGYEEAAAQGLMAGANAAFKVRGEPELVLAGDQSYIGVLIDDLTSRGTDEPYRMFTSRAEHRLQLREDNADLRLTSVGYARGLVASEQAMKVEQKRKLLMEAHALASANRIEGELLAQRLRRPGADIGSIPEAIRRHATIEIWRHLITDLKYDGYISRKQTFLTCREQVIPPTFDFAGVPGLRGETRQKLAHVRPSSLSQAERIPGITHADLSILAVWLRKGGIF